MAREGIASQFTCKADPTDVNWREPKKRGRAGAKRKKDPTTVDAGVLLGPGWEEEQTQVDRRAEELH